MMDYIYNERNEAVGFWKRGHVYEMSGKPVGQLRDTHIHTLSGEYIGELYKEMVVDKHIGQQGNIGNSGNHDNAESHGNPGNRGVVICIYPNVWESLLEKHATGKI